jgi:Zn-dependent protease
MERHGLGSYLVGFVLAVRTGLVQSGHDPLLRLLVAGVQINAILALFNLVPLPPLDGSKVAAWGLPRAMADAYVRLMEPYSSWILLVLFIPLSMVLSPLIDALTRILSSMVR